MRASQRNAKILAAVTERPWRWVSIMWRNKPKQVKVRHFGDGALRRCVGEAEVAAPISIIPKLVLRRRRQIAQREAERRAA